MVDWYSYYKEPHGHPPSWDESYKRRKIMERMKCRICECCYWKKKMAKRWVGSMSREASGHYKRINLCKACLKRELEIKRKELIGEK
jgi:hypothetical protein